MLRAWDPRIDINFEFPMVSDSSIQLCIQTTSLVYQKPSTLARSLMPDTANMILHSRPFDPIRYAYCNQTGLQSQDEFL